MYRLTAFILFLAFGKAAFADSLELNATIYLQTENTTRALLEGTSKGGFEFHSWRAQDDYQGEPINILIGLEDEKKQVWIKAWLGDDSYHLRPEDELIVDKTMDVSAMAAATTPVHTFPNGARIFVNTTPRLAAVKPDSIDLTTANMGLDYLCLKNSSAVIDDTFQLGRLSGFGARFTIDVPDFHLVTFSVRQFDGYQAIGEYHNGLITIALGDHQLTINAVRFGPTGQYLTGPFTIYGRLDPSEVGAARGRQGAKERLRRQLDPATASQLIAHIDTMPFAPLSRITSDLMLKPSPQLRALIGPWAADLEACSR